MLDTPHLQIHLPHLRQNIQTALRIAGRPHRLRPHVKTHKSLAVARLQLAAGISKFKCATIAEAEMLGMAGAPDVLIAYPVQGPKAERVKKLREKYVETDFAVLVDNFASADHLDQTFADTQPPLRVFIDLNNGQNRTGCLLENAPELATYCTKLPHLHLVGLHCYDGHLRMPDLAERTQKIREAFVPVRTLHRSLEKQLDHPLTLIAGGSPSFPVHAEYHEEVECSPGTFIFWDQRYAENYPEQGFHKAAVLHTRVISKLDARTYCLDLGHKSVASESPFPRVVFDFPHELQQVGHSEEHLIVRSREPDVLTPGQILRAYPYHICPTVALYERLLVTNGANIIDEWTVTARNRRITI